jgi:hypothetical protein
MYLFHDHLLLAMKKITLFSESPFTIDFVYELKTNFRTTVTDKLDERSKNAILTQQDPATMTDSEVVTLRNTISRFIYGNVLDFCQLPVFCSLKQSFFYGFLDVFYGFYMVISYCPVLVCIVFFNHSVFDGQLYYLIQCTHIPETCPLPYVLMSSQISVRPLNCQM